MPDGVELLLTMREILVFKGRKKLFRALQARTHFEKAKGIMFQPRLFTPLLFEFDSPSRAKNAIHSFFCTPFEAIFLDEKKRVVDVKSVPSSRLIVLPKVNSLYLIEAPIGTAAKHAILGGKALWWKATGELPGKKRRTK
ncbi:DUF192 domain-containing protein [Candidatus Micrarchaeota archaeon]|nr:DUF192 domain-containing protein [Candidatus Micrarchaeota archaeon]